MINIMIIFKLAEKMEYSEITAYRLAQMTEIHETQIGRLKNGKVKSVSFETLDKLCEALGCEPGDLLVRTTNGLSTPAEARKKIIKPKQKSSRLKAKA